MEKSCNQEYLCQIEDVLAYLSCQTDLLTLVKNSYYSDLLEALRVDSLKDLTTKSTFDDFLDAGVVLYNLNHCLNRTLDLTHLNHDNQCVYFTANEILKRFEDAPSLNDINVEDFAQLISDNCHLYAAKKNPISRDEAIVMLDKIISSEYKQNETSTDIKEFFNKLIYINPHAMIYRYTPTHSQTIPNNDAYTENHVENLKNHMADLIESKGLSPNTVGTIGHIANFGKYVNLINTDVPTKEVLIRFSFVLELTYFEFETLFSLARKTVENTINSSKFTFEPNSPRDNCILRWVRNMKQLKEQSGNKTDSLVDTLNGILIYENLDPLGFKPLTKK